MATLRRWIEQILADIAAQGLFVWLKGSLIVTSLLALWEWFQGRSPLEIVFLAIILAILLVGLFEILAKRRERRNRKYATTQDRAPSERINDDRFDETMREELLTLWNGWARPSFRGIHHLLYSLNRKIQIEDTGDLFKELIEKRVLDRALQIETVALAPLTEEKNPTYGDRLPMQRAFEGLYAEYQQLTGYHHKVADLIRHDLTTDREYQKWRQLDRDFLNKLKEMSAHPRFDYLRNQINGIGWGDKYRGNANAAT